MISEGTGEPRSVAAAEKTEAPKDAPKSANKGKEPADVENKSEPIDEEDNEEEV